MNMSFLLSLILFLSFLDKDKYISISILDLNIGDFKTQSYQGFAEKYDN